MNSRIKQLHPNFFLILRTFVLLLLGLSVVVGCTIYLVNSYWALTYTRYTKHRLYYDVAKIVSIADELPEKQFKKIHKHLRYLGINLHINHKTYYHNHTMTQLNLHQLRHEINKAHEYFHLSFLLKNKDNSQSNKATWLNISARMVTWRWFSFSFAFPSIVLLVTALLFCFWIIMRFMLPTWQLGEAAKRFGRDMHAPPLAEIGPPGIRTTITAFNDMQARIRQMLRDRTQMLAAISHDLRTPITRLKLRVESIEDKTKYQKAIDDLDEMEHMITSILSFAQDNFREERLENFDLITLLESICDDMQDVGKEAYFQTNNDSILFSGRLNALKRAFTNIIENAIKYGKRAEVTLSATEQNIILEIADDGPGLPVTELEKVFLPFYRADAARSPTISGSGLGLAVARDIIRMHGGDIKLSNRKPNGLLVIISLPIGLYNQ